MKMTYEFDVEIENVEYLESNKEEAGLWLLGRATVNWTITGPNMDDNGTCDVRVGCWADTDDDLAEWNYAHEGARVLRAIMGVQVERPCDSIGATFIDCCEKLGAGICRRLREAAHVRNYS